MYTFHWIFVSIKIIKMKLKMEMGIGQRDNNPTNEKVTGDILYILV